MDNVISFKWRVNDILKLINECRIVKTIFTWQYLRSILPYLPFINLCIHSMTKNGWEWKLKPTMGTPMLQKLNTITIVLNFSLSLFLSLHISHWQLTINISWRNLEWDIKDIEIITFHPCHVTNYITKFPFLFFIYPEHYWVPCNYFYEVVSYPQKDSRSHGIHLALRNHLRLLFFFLKTNF